MTMARRIHSKIARSVEVTVIIGVSVLVLLSLSPLLGDVSNYLIIVYFIFVPGYALTPLLAEEYDVLSRLLYSVLVGLVLLLTLLALQGDALLLIPTHFALTIPLITIAVESYVYYSKRQH